MLITETKTVQREIHVAPCLECGNTDIMLSDCNYSSFNKGGGKCKKCGHEVSASVGTFPTMDELAAIWNASNDIPTLIRAEEAKIAEAEARIAALKVKRGQELTPLDDDEKEECLMTAEDFIRDEKAGCFTCDDGNGVWATATHKSDIDTGLPRPDWATHVVWYNR